LYSILILLYSFIFVYILEGGVAGGLPPAEGGMAQRSAP